MTKSLATLIKLHRLKLDEMRKEMVILQDVRDQCLRHLEELAGEMRQEQAAAGTDEGRFIYANYLKRAKERRARLQTVLSDANQKIANLELAMQAEFGEVKKFEIMKERKDREAEAELARREGAMLDEVGITGYNRKEEQA